MRNDDVGIDKSFSESESETGNFHDDFIGALEIITSVFIIAMFLAESFIVAIATMKALGL